MRCLEVFNDLGLHRRVFQPFLPLPFRRGPCGPEGVCPGASAIRLYALYQRCEQHKAVLGHLDPRSSVVRDASLARNRSGAIRSNSRPNNTETQSMSARISGIKIHFPQATLIRCGSPWKKARPRIRTRCWSAAHVHRITSRPESAFSGLMDSLPLVHPIPPSFRFRCPGRIR